MEQASLSFAGPLVEKAFRERARMQKMDPEHAALGTQFSKEILTGYIPPVYVADVSPRVGKGLFTIAPIQKGSYVGEYGGEIRENNEHWEMNHYLYSLPVLDPIERPYVIDAKEGNLLRFVNHSFQPNLLPKYAFLEGIYHVIFLASIDIPANSQLTFNYGKNYWKIRQKPEEF